MFGSYRSISCILEFGSPGRMYTARHSIGFISKAQVHSANSKNTAMITMALPSEEATLR
jgi:hypothetical protein